MKHTIRYCCGHSVTLLAFSSDDRFMDAFISAIMRGLCPACVAFECTLMMGELLSASASPREAAMRVLKDAEERMVRVAAQEAQAQAAKGAKP